MPCFFRVTKHSVLADTLSRKILNLKGKDGSDQNMTEQIVTCKGKKGPHMQNM